MARVLLLNASWEPLRIISTKRAVVLVLQEKAEIIHEGDGEIRSANLAVPQPEVIRLKYFVQVPYRARIPLTNRNVLMRDHYKCAYCTDRRADTVDHVVPRAKGGQHRWENVVACCRKCNSRKSDKTLKDMGWDLDFNPYAPRGTFWLVVGYRDVSDAWEPYLANFANS